MRGMIRSVSLRRIHTTPSSGRGYISRSLTKYPNNLQIRLKRPYIVGVILGVLVLFEKGPKVLHWCMRDM